MDFHTMDDRVDRLAARMDALTQMCVDLERRVNAIEAGTASPTQPIWSPPPALTAVTLAADAQPRPAAEIGLASLVGRTLLIFAGAYLLRALTDLGLVAPAPGLTLGLVYAITWSVLAHRSATHARGAAAAWHGSTTILIACPLLFEAVVRFELLSAAAGALGLVAVGALVVRIASRDDLQPLAWLATIGTVTTAVLLMFAVQTPLPIAAALVLLLIVVDWTGHGHGWWLLGWPPAAAANVIVLAATFQALTPRGAALRPAVLALQLVLVGAALATPAVRALLLRWPLSPFHAAQAAVATTIGLGGASLVAPLVGVELALGAATLAVALLWYAAAAVLDRTTSDDLTDGFVVTAALTLAMFGSAMLMDRPWLVAAWSAGAATAALVAWRSGGTAPLSHACAYAIAAASAGGLFSYVGRVLLVPATAGWPALRGSIALGLLALAVCALVPNGRVSPQLRLAIGRTMTALLLAGVLGIATGLAAPILIDAANASPLDGGLVAIVRTAVLALGAVALAGLARWSSFDVQWLVQPLLALGGLKLMIEDFPRGRPSTLFVSLALYGAALVAASRLARQDTAGAGEAPAARPAALEPPASTVEVAGRR